MKAGRLLLPVAARQVISAALSVRQIVGPVPPCQQGDHASDGDGAGEHWGADPGSGGQCAPADGAQYF